VKTTIREKPGNRFTERQRGHIALATSSAISISSSAFPSSAAGTVRIKNATFIADDVGLVASGYRTQTSAAIRIAEVSVRNDRRSSSFDARAVAHWPITRFGERRAISVAVSTTRVMPIADRNASTAGRRRKRAGLRLTLVVHTFQFRPRL